MYTLYYSPGAASLCVHLALLETHAPHELKKVDLAAGQQRDPAYLKLNPNGVVPTLLIDGKPFYEAAAALMTIAERHPEAKLVSPADSLARAAWNQWILHLANTLQPAFRLWFYPQDIAADAATQDVIKLAAQRKIEAAWERLEAHLSANGPYLLGDMPSAADLLLIMLMRWSRNMPRPATQWHALAAYASRMKSRPSWKRLYAVEGLTEWS
ncbi:MAG: glutathione S-transferase family protein [Proteobacteria bacterium]|nr:glutathione S-transferase family protein [Pseudomonadota bacterium]